MISLYTGTPGSGKSYHAAIDIYNWLRSGKNVISSININTSIIPPRSAHRPLGEFIYVHKSYFMKNSIYLKTSLGGKVAADNVYSYVYGLLNYALQFHKRNYRGQIIENQTLLVIDEVNEIFNPRSWNKKDRQAWINFFTEHRKYGFKIILIVQADIMIDKQIRSVLQEQVLHRNVSRFKKLGKIIAFPFGGNLFVAIRSTYETKNKKDARLGASLIFGSDYYVQLYDSYALSDPLI